MGYATRDDLIRRFGADEIDSLDAGSASGAWPRLQAALADADAEINAVLAARWSLPLPAGLYPLLNAIACDIARSRLYDETITEAVQERAMRARAKLRRIGAGGYDLVTDAGQIVPPKDSFGGAVSGAASRFGRAALEGL